MKNATACAAKLAALLETLPAVAAPDFPDQDEPLAVLVQSFLLWETTTEKAKAGWTRLRGSIVDYNDLRVSMAHESVTMIGSRYPAGIARCERIRAALRDVYLREHAVALDSLREAGKRDVRRYLESLDGMVPFVAARTMLLAFDVHAVPVDKTLRTKLVLAGAADEEADDAEVGAYLSRQVKANDGRDMHYRLQAWAETPAAKSTTKKSRGTRRKTTKKGEDGASGSGGRRRTADAGT